MSDFFVILKTGGRSFGAPPGAPQSHSWLEPSVLICETLSTLITRILPTHPAPSSLPPSQKMMTALRTRCLSPGWLAFSNCHPSGACVASKTHVAHPVACCSLAVREKTHADGGREEGRVGGSKGQREGESKWGREQGTPVLVGVAGMQRGGARGAWLHNMTFWKPVADLLIAGGLVASPELIQGGGDLVGGGCKVLVSELLPHLIILVQPMLLLFNFACIRSARLLPPQRDHETFA